MTKEKVVLAYSGGLDTSVAIQWLNDEIYIILAPKSAVERRTNYNGTSTESVLAQIEQGKSKLN